MKMLVSEVIRAANKDGLHGSLFIYNFDTNKKEHKYLLTQKDVQEWSNPRGGERGFRGVEVKDNKIYAATSRRIIIFNNELEIIDTIQNDNVLQSIHEICFFNNRLYVTSTHYNSIVEIDVEERRVINCWHVHNGQKEQTMKPKQQDLEHINSISSYGGRLVYSGAPLNYLVDFDTGKKICHINSSDKHNFVEYNDIFACNLTRDQQFCIVDKNSGSHKRYNFSFPKEERDNNSDDKIATFNWLRGLEREGNIFYIGSSPSRIIVFDYEKEKRVQIHKFSEDVRHCIHGLKILPKGF